MAGPIRNLIRAIRENRQNRIERRQGQRTRDDRPLQLSGRSGLPLFRSLGAGTSRLDAQVASRIAARYPADRPMQARPDGPDIGQYAGNRPDGVVFPTETVAPAAEPARTTAPRQQAGTKALPVSRVPDPDRTSGMAGPQVVRGGTESLPAPPPELTPRQALVNKRDTAHKNLSQVQQRLNMGGLTPDNLASLQTSAVIANSQLNDYAQQLAAMDEAENSGPAAGINAVSDLADKAARGLVPWENVTRLASGTFAITTEAGVQMPPEAAARRVSRPVVERYAAELHDKYRGFGQMPDSDRANLTRGLIFAYPLTPDMAANPQALDEYTKRVTLQLNSVMNQEQSPEKYLYFNALAKYMRNIQLKGYQDPPEQKAK